jgi:hypothetical protein
VLLLWKAGERWYMNMAETGRLNNHNEDFTTPDPIDERIADGFGWGPHVVVWEWATATEVLLRIGIKDPGKQQTIAAARALKKLNGEQRKKTNGKVLFAIPAASNDFLG